MRVVQASRPDSGREWIVLVPGEHWDGFLEYAEETRLSLRPRGRTGGMRRAELAPGLSPVEVREILESCFDGGPEVRVGEDEPVRPSGAGAVVQKRSEIAVHLVSCVARKAAGPRPARDLYESAWFRKARAHVEAQGGPWFILSAEHGLLAPDEVIAPYERTLNRMGVAERRAWADRVAEQLRGRLPRTRRIVVLAGMRYREFLMETLRQLCPRVEVPMRGMRIGEQLRWLS